MNMQSEWASRECPSCGSKVISSKPVQISAIPAESLTWMEIKNLFVGLRATQSFFSYQRCVDCHLAYNNYYFSQSQLDELYHLMPNNLMGENVGTASKTQYRYADMILGETKTLKTYLELGPDIGLIGRRISETFPESAAYLVEPNKGVHNDLSKNSQGFRNATVLVDLIEAENTLESNADLIVGIHVLDHLLDPAHTLRKLHGLANKDARLCIVVHNEKSLLRFVLNKKWPPFCLQHPVLYNKKTIQAILKETGWEVTNIKNTVNHYSIRNLAKNFFAIMNFPSTLSKFLPQIEIPVTLGNILVTAQRRDAMESQNSLNQ